MVGARPSGAGKKVALRAVVAGGGIGGIAAAVALVRAGIDVQVHEQAQQLAEVGRHFLVFPVRAGQLLNYVGFVPSDTAVRESWSAPGDPVALATLLGACASPAGVPRALAAYEGLRRDRTARVQLGSRRQGAGWDSSGRQLAEAIALT